MLWLVCTVYVHFYASVGWAMMEISCHFSCIAKNFGPVVTLQNHLWVSVLLLCSNRCSVSLSTWGSVGWSNYFYTFCRANGKRVCSSQAWQPPDVGTANAMIRAVQIALQMYHGGALFEYRGQGRSTSSQRMEKLGFVSFFTVQSYDVRK